IGELQEWSPDLTEAQLDQPFFELELDSLDRLDIIHLLERESQVDAQAEDIEHLTTFRQYIRHFLGLAGQQ
ncbi:MAG: acyl carrier protein, partial [Propionibacteriaceae bacterium]|nr:acyl carrier protein [Propionibacteriaceae bacterium]